MMDCFLFVVVLLTSWHQQSNSEPSNVLGIFGLSARTREDKLEKEFAKFGKIDSVSIIYDRQVSELVFLYFHLNSSVVPPCVEKYIL